MTNIELETMSAIRAAARKYMDKKEIDWEQRRYEISKDILAARLSTRNFAHEDENAYVKSCVDYADMLIRLLKNG